MKKYVSPFLTIEKLNTFDAVTASNTPSGSSSQGALRKNSDNNVSFNDLLREGIFSDYYN